MLLTFWNFLTSICRNQTHCGIQSCGLIELCLEENGEAYVPKNTIPTVELGRGIALFFSSRRIGESFQFDVGLDNDPKHTAKLM